MRLSHTIAPSEWLVQFLLNNLPQLKSVFAFAIYENKAQVGHSNNGPLPAKDMKRFASFVNQSNSGWYAADETPIAHSKKIGQIGLEGELDRDFLFVRDLEYGETQVCVLLQLSAFTVSSQPYLSAGEKRLLELFVRQMLQGFLNQQTQDRQLLKHIAYANEGLKKDVQQLNHQIERTQKNFEGTLKQLLKLLFNRLAAYHQIVIHYTPSFTQAVIGFSGDYADLEKHLEQQVAIAANLAQLTDESEVWLDDSNVKTFKPLRTGKTNAVKELPMNLGRLAKAHALLDRYETSASLVKQSGLSIIGKHIGEHCEPSISNAAITDALSKNAKKIYELFERFPAKWPIIRSDFRSIANIIEKENLRRAAV